MSRFVRLTFPLLSLAVVLVAFRGGTSGADPMPSTDRLNKVVENVTFTDAAGKASSLKDHAGKTATVVCFLSFDCPVSNSYAATLAALHKA